MNADAHPFAGLDGALAHERTHKPRSHGLTMVADWGLGLQQQCDLTHTSGAHFDFAKIAVGTSQGKLRLPFAITDGSQLDNADDDTVSKLYYGICNGRPFRRCSNWRMSEEHVEQVGAIYEKISADEYVIPDMDERSTALRALYALGYRYPYRMVGLMHQAEFMGIEQNCYCATSIEPWIPEALQELQDRWARYVIEHWEGMGGRPIEKIDHHRWGPDLWVIDPVTGQVRKMGNNFVTLHFDCPSLTIETQMNDPRTSPEEQMRLSAAAMEASLRFLLEGM